MSLFLIISIFITLTSFGLSAFLLSKEGKDPVKKAFGIFGLSIGIWGFAGSIISLIPKSNPSSALFWWQIAYTGIIFIPIFYAQFVFAFLKIKKPIFLFCIYVLGMIFLFFNWVGKSQLFLVDLKFIYSQFYWHDWLKSRSIIYLVFYISFYLCLLAFPFLLLLLNLKHTSGQSRTQVKYIILGSIFGWLGGESNFLPDFGIPIYPFLGILTPIYVLIVSYAIVRHQLMDIEVVIKKSLVFAGMFAFAFGVFVAVTLLVSQFLGSNSLVSLAVSALIIIVSLRPLESWLLNATDKFLFQKKYEYKQIIKTFIDGVVTEFNLDRVISSTLKLLDETLHPYTAAVFILNKSEDTYQLFNALNLQDKNIVFTSDSKLVTFLKKSQSPAVIRQIDGIVGVNPEIAVEMAKLKAVIVLPLMLHNDLIGFISLGKKKSDEDYSKDDLDVLLDLSRTESIAVANAQLLTEAAQSERRAAIGTMAAGINHEIGNPLNIITTKIQYFLLSKERGLFKEKSKEEILQDCTTILNETNKQANRISEITRKLSNFAKPSKEFKPELFSIPEEIEETLAVVGHDLELEKVKIEKRFAADLAKILADRREIQQIFFNLIRNAAQAIEEHGTITIRGTNFNNKVRIEIQDTGKGISEDRMHRVFEPFFTTKGPNKGTGLGLSIVRQLVWKNKGEISFASKAGSGTTFMVEFPKGEGV